MSALTLVSSQSAEAASRYQTHPSTCMDGRIDSCQDCNYDTHTCQGCGANVTHEQGRVCLKCRNTYGVS